MIAWRVAAVLGIVAGVAGADDTPAPVAPTTDPDHLAALPPEVVQATSAATTYPRGLVDRPLVLRAGMLEGVGALSLRRDDPSDEVAGTYRVTSFGPSVRYALSSAFEIEGGVSLILHVSPEFFSVGDRLALVFAAARYAMSPDMTVGLQLVATGLTDDPRTLTPRLVLGRKQQFTRRLAIESAFAPGFARTTGIRLGIDDRVQAPLTAFVATGQARVQYQLAPHYALEGRAALHLRYEDSEGTTLAHDYGVRVVASLTPTIDLAPGVDLFVLDEATAIQLSLELRARNQR